jgi:prepilin-type N-terminal cleavage/methylation domain-containing protein
MRAGRRIDRPGFTLIELLFAVSIMAFALLGVAGMFPAAYRSVMAGGHESKATALARQMLEEIRADAFDSLVSRYNALDTRSLTVTCPVPLPTPSSPDPDYNKKKWACDLRPTGTADPGPDNSGQGLPAGYGAVTVACVNPDGSSGSCGGTDLRRVTVTVSWESRVSRSISLVSYVGRLE